MVKMWKNATLRMLNSHRNYCQGQVFFHVKKKVREEGLGTFPTMDDIVKIVSRDPILLPPAEGASPEEVTEHERLLGLAAWFCNCIVANVAGASVWYRPEVRK